MIELNNAFLKVGIKKRGAEICSLYHKAAAIEHIWQGDSAVWPWHAPNLFPIVGGLINNQVIIDEKTYTMNRHGFARASDFVLIESSGTHAIFSLRFNEETLQSYPYRFEFQLVYHLDGRHLTCLQKVINLENREILFSVGGHPAFNAPFFPNEAYEDYYLAFSNSENLLAHQLSPAGYFNGTTQPIALDDGRLWLKKDLFNQDALVFKTLQSRAITLRSKNHDYGVQVSFPDYKSLGLWAKPGAPFVCIEPWLGYADQENDTPFTIQQKEGMVRLAGGHVFESSINISIL